MGAQVVFRAAQAVHLAGSFVVAILYVDVILVAVAVLAPVVRSVAMILARSSNIFALGTLLMSWYCGFGRYSWLSLPKNGVPARISCSSSSTMLSCSLDSCSVDNGTAEFAAGWRNRSSTACESMCCRVKSTVGTAEFSCDVCMLIISILLCEYGTCTGSRDVTMCSTNEDMDFRVSNAVG